MVGFIRDNAFARPSAAGAANRHPHAFTLISIRTEGYRTGAPDEQRDQLHVKFRLPDGLKKRREKPVGILM